MLIQLLPTLHTSFPRTFIIKSNANNGGNPPFPVIAFINEEVTGCINEETIDANNEAAIGAIIAPRGESYFFISCFTVLIAPSVNRPDFSSDSTILATLLISSFQMNKVNLFLLL